jgi:glycosyltransferase involved in cell wall biosynthesis
VRGLAEHDFSIVAITGSGEERQVWELPGNVSALTVIPLWDAAVRSRRSSRSFSAKARAIRANTREVALRLVSALLESELSWARVSFSDALRAWSTCAAIEDAERELVSREFVGLLLARWSTGGLAEHWGGSLRRGTPTVGDAVAVTRMIAHSLRPLRGLSPSADLVHPVSNGIAGLVALAAKWRHGIPYVLSEHGIYLRERYLSFRGKHTSWPAKWLMLRFYRLLTVAVYQEAALVAPGNAYNRRWELLDGVPDGSIRTVYNGVDPERFNVTDLTPEVPTVAWVGRIDPLKDLETLIRGFALVNARRPQARLRIFGGTPKGNESYRDSMVALAAHLGLSDVVVFEGRVEVIRDAYVAGDVVALTSISEGFPYTVIEAMSCGRATVCTDVGGVAEAVGDAGLVVPPRDPQAFADACLTILNDRALREDLAMRARQRVLELFTLEQSIEAFRAIYTDVAEGKMAVSCA